MRLTDISGEKKEEAKYFQYSEYLNTLGEWQQTNDGDSPDDASEKDITAIMKVTADIFVITWLNGNKSVVRGVQTNLF